MLNRENLMVLTVWNRILDIIMRIMKALAELIWISAEELVEVLIRGENSLAKCEMMQRTGKVRGSLVVIMYSILNI